MSWQLQGSNHHRGRPLFVEFAPPGELEDHEPGTVRRGWQHVAASVVEELANLQGNDHPFPPVSISSAVSNRGFVHADVAVSLTPLAMLHVFVLGVEPSGFSRESGEARGRVRNHRSRCPDATPGDGRRLEVVVDGLPLFGGQLAIDTRCMVTSDHREGRAKEQRFGVQARARLVFLAVEVGGRFSKETNGFLTGLAKARARSEPPLMQRRVEQAWRMRWSWLLGCAAATAVVGSLLEMQGCVCSDGASPAGHEGKGTSIMPALRHRQA